MKLFKFQLHGTTPILINRFTDTDARPPHAHSKKLTPHERAELRLWRDGKDIVAPSVWVISALRMAAADFRHKRKTTSGVTATSEFMHFHDPETGATVQVFQPHVTVCKTCPQSTVLVRPKLEQWSLRGEFQIEDDLLDPSVVRELLDAAGRRYGIGAFRPAMGGPFGTFTVTEWTEVRETKGNGKDLEPLHPMN